jgi:tRNA modification GTPase
MDTIFAPITAVAKSAVVVIRISGAQVLNCLKHLGIKQALEPRMATLYNLKHHDEIIDQALITFFKNPESFTGEDVAEIAVHGSIYIIQKITDALLELENVRLAEAGEFSKRAFLNSKMDLVQAEAIVDLIESETALQHRQALQQLQGELGEIYDSWREKLIKITANIEAFIDFPDEDLPQDIVDDLENRVGDLVLQIKEHLNDNQRGEKIRQGLSLAIIGAPNVGKSSLINYLAKSDVAIVSEIAGTTRDIINVHLNIAGAAVVISDTAGLRNSDDVIEQEGIKRALQKADLADLKILLIDAANPEIDQNLIDEKTLLVINKIDLENNFSIAKNQSAIAISLKQNLNLNQLLDELEKRVKNLTLAGNSPPITRARYRAALKDVVDNLSQFSLDKNIEFAAEDLRLAIRAIGKITGRVEVDDILDVIFSGFCIGK